MIRSRIQYNNGSRCKGNRRRAKLFSGAGVGRVHRAGFNQGVLKDKCVMGTQMGEGVLERVSSKYRVRYLQAHHTFEGLQEV